MAGHPAFERLAAPGVRALQPYLPGKPVEELERESGIRESIKLASNENPLGPPAAAVAAIHAAAQGVALYPDGAGYELKQKLADRLGVPADWLTLGNGSNDVLAMLAETFLQPGCEAVYDQHGFVMFALVVQATGATGRAAASLPADHPVQPLGHDPQAMLDCVGPDTRLLFIANPNNPTGSWLDREAVCGLLDRLPADVIVVLDEAYTEYVDEADYPDGLQLMRRYPNLVVTRTFSKVYALAGLRIGYAVAHPEITELLNRVRQPFNTSLVAQQAAMAALDDQDFVRRAAELNRTGLQQLSAGLAELGLRPLPSAGNFVLVDVGEPAGPCYAALLRAGVIVRPVANYGLPDYLRITVGLPDQNERVLQALAEFLAGRGS